MNKLKRFVAYYRPYKKALVLDLMFAAISSLAVLAYPLIVNRMTASAISDHGIDSGLLLQMVGVFLFLMLVEYGSSFYTDYYGHAMGAQMEADMRRDLFRHVQRLPFFVPR